MGYTAAAAAAVDGDAARQLEVERLVVIAQVRHTGGAAAPLVRRREPMSEYPATHASVSYVIC